MLVMLLGLEKKLQGNATESEETKTGRNQGGEEPRARSDKLLASKIRLINLF